MHSGRTDARVPRHYWPSWGTLAFALLTPPFYHAPLAPPPFLPFPPPLPVLSVPRDLFRLFFFLLFFFHYYSLSDQDRYMLNENSLVINTCWRNPLTGFSYDFLFWIRINMLYFFYFSIISYYYLFWIKICRLYLFIFSLLLSLLDQNRHVLFFSYLFNIIYFG